MNNDSQGEPRRGVSRRGFLTGTGAAAAVTSLTGELVSPAVGQETPEKAPAFGCLIPTFINNSPRKFN